jgi:Protein of unknown function (DUF1838)
VTPRRGFLAGLLATASVAAIDDTAGAQPKGSIEDPAAFNRYYRRIRYAPGDDLLFWWMRGRRYGLVDNQLTPFFDMHVGSMHRCRDLDSDRYEVSSAATIYFTDLDSGELLESWNNPVTGKVVRFNYAPPRAGRSEYSYREGVRESAPMPGVRQDERHTHTALQIIGEEAWFTEEVSMIAHFEATGKSIKVHDTSTYGSPVAALLDPSVRFVPAVEHFNDYNDWSPRFQMGDKPGTSVARCSGRKVATLEEMPDDFLRIARRIHPDAFRDPARTLG